MTTLPENATLAQTQTYIKELCEHHGWVKGSGLEIFLLFTEEVGELAKAIRYHEKIQTESGKNQDLEGEFADVLSYILDLANHYGVDLDQALRKKQGANFEREWK